MISENSARVVINRWHKKPQGGYRALVSPTADEFDAVVSLASDEAVDVCLGGLGFAREVSETQAHGDIVVIETADGAVRLGSIIDSDPDLGLTSIGPE